MPAKKQPPLDRLGALPDDVLLHILSFLPTTRLSVCTSVLSRRWRSLWAHVPLLSFQCGGGCERRFRDIVTEVVSAHKGQTVHTFQLTNYSSDYEFEIEGWIPALVFRNVRNISIYLSGLGGERVMMPNCLLMCETLVELKIGGYVVIPAAFDVCLPALKRLLIGGAESLPRLISGCPVLEELDIFNCDMVQNLEICSRTLLRLELNIEPLDYGFVHGRKKYWVKLLTPALRFLSIHEYVFDNISVGTLGSLAVADVSLGCYFPKSCSRLEFVGKLCNVGNLYLNFIGMQLPDSAFSALNVKFHNLTKLALTADWRFISFFLEKADNLQVLTIHHGGDNIKEWREPHQVPTCLSSHLKTVTIEPFKCTKEWLFISYVLRNAEVLKLMKVVKIHYSPCKDLEFDALKRRILQLQPGSKESV